MKKLLLLFILAFSININAQVKDSISVDKFQKTDEVLSKVIKKALIVAEKTGEFVIEQSPLLLQEFYNWNISKSILGILLGIVIFLLGRYIPYIWMNKTESQGKYSNKFFKRYSINEYPENGIYTAWVIFSIGSLVSITQISINSYNLLYILLAPKLYLIDYFIK